MDDFETATYTIVCTEEPIDDDARSKAIGRVPPFYDPETREIRLDWSNGMGQDRSRMGADWSGIPGVLMEDAAMSLSLDRDWDRSSETLVAADAAIVRMRRRILDAIRRHQAGEPPPGLGRVDLSDVMGFDRDLKADEKWQDIMNIEEYVSSK